jgi:hypothetical protein
LNLAVEQYFVVVLLLGLALALNFYNLALPGQELTKSRYLSTIYYDLRIKRRQIKALGLVYLSPRRARSDRARRQHVD